MKSIGDDCRAGQWLVGPVRRRSSWWTMPRRIVPQRYCLRCRFAARAARLQSRQGGGPVHRHELRSGSWRQRYSYAGWGRTARPPRCADYAGRPRPLPKRYRDCCAQKKPPLCAMARGAPPTPWRIFGLAGPPGIEFAIHSQGFGSIPPQCLHTLQVNADQGRNFVFESEILIEAAWLGVSFVAVPIHTVVPELAGWATQLLSAFRGYERCHLQNGGLAAVSQRHAPHWVAAERTEPNAMLPSSSLQRVVAMG